MANALYPVSIKKFADGEIDWLDADIKVVLVDTGAYTYSAAHEDLADIAAGARIATSGGLASKTSTGGVCDAADVVVSGVTGTTVEAVVVYKDTGTAATSPLIAYIDTGTGFPLTPNGGAVTVQWSNGADKIFSL